MNDDDVRVRIVTIVCLAVILLAAVIGITFVSILTDRDLFRAEAFTFGGTLLLAGLGGISWATIRRRRRKLHIDYGEPREDDET